MIDSSAAPMIQQTNIGDKGEKKDVVSGEAKVIKVEKGKGIVDLTITTPPIAMILPQILINLDGSVDLGKMSPTKKLILVVIVQAQASQDLVKSENEDKKLILMSIDVL